MSRSAIQRLTNPAGLRFEINANGSIRRMLQGTTCINLFPGNEIEGGPANVYLIEGETRQRSVPLLGPGSPTRFRMNERAWFGQGVWRDIEYRLTLMLADQACAWAWRLELRNLAETRREVRPLLVQDIALSPYDTVRLNEYYVSQYVDHEPLKHPTHGWVVASRQNLATAGRHPWCVHGAFRCATAFATDALQILGLPSRSGGAPAFRAGLPAQRLQHEHSMLALEDTVIELQPGAQALCGFFGVMLLDHPEATSRDDLRHIEPWCSLAAWQVQAEPMTPRRAAAATVFTQAPSLAVREATALDIDGLITAERRHEEHDGTGQLLSFFHGEARHVVLAAKERAVLRPHGHMLRSGSHAVPDESALTSTVWMAGVFHSMLTQGHVSFNRLLTTVHSYLGLFRSHGLRLFIDVDGRWQRLDVPSLFEMTPTLCRWLYLNDLGCLEVCSATRADDHVMTLTVANHGGPPPRVLLSWHLALNGDDGEAGGSVRRHLQEQTITVAPDLNSELARRFPAGCFTIEAASGTQLEQVGGDELLFDDEVSRGLPFLCVIARAAAAMSFEIRGQLVRGGIDVPTEDAPAPALQLLRWRAPDTPLAQPLQRLGDMLPWFEHNAWVHYLAPRGLEQYSGGGWGTRDVCQGPVELLLASGRIQPMRALLLRVLSAQHPDGDWPQWFMFFERDRHIRAGDSHGDIVFWPVLALAQYLIASADADMLAQRVPFYAPPQQIVEMGTVWEHLQRALRVMQARRIDQTALAAYGHGDWNDALQPADPDMRDFMCSAWTVTLHHQTLTTLAQALRTVGRGAEAIELDDQARQILADFRRLLIVDDVLTGYALFEPDAPMRCLLHPNEEVTGVRYSALAMIHAVLEDMLDAAHTQSHLDLLANDLSGPDGIRLFDRPLRYRGGRQHYFQRAESATFFGREIGLMYMHAHLRYAQALAHVGDAQRFFTALCQVNPIGLQRLVPATALRQANCYYSSSDAAFHDRYQASAEYERVYAGTVPLEGGWRIYSSGAGIAVSLIVRRLFGLDLQARSLCLDPVLPKALDGLIVHVRLMGRELTIEYRVGEQGCGVRRVTMNDQELAIRREMNPHRMGAVHVARDALLAAWGGDDNRLVLDIA